MTESFIRSVSNDLYLAPMLLEIIYLIYIASYITIKKNKIAPWYSEICILNNKRFIGISHLSNSPDKSCRCDAPRTIYGPSNFTRDHKNYIFSRVSRGFLRFKQLQLYFATSYIYMCDQNIMYLMRNHFESAFKPFEKYIFPYCYCSYIKKWEFAVIKELIAYKVSMSFVSAR